MSSKAGPTVRTITITNARNNLDDLVERVQRDKEYVILKRNGTAVAGIMDIDEFEDYLEVNDPAAQRAIRKSTEEFRAGKGRPAREFLAELRAEEQKRSKHRAKR